MFPDAAPLHLSRIQLALERAGFVTDHVEGLAQDYVDTLSAWIDRLDQTARRPSGWRAASALRVWRLYPRAARERRSRPGSTSIYQVLAHHA